MWGAPTRFVRGVAAAATWRRNANARKIDRLLPTTGNPVVGALLGDALCHRLPSSPPAREEVDSGGADSGERNVVAAADGAALDDVGIDTDIRFVVLRCGAQDAGVFG